MLWVGGRVKNAPHCLTQPYSGGPVDVVRCCISDALATLQKLELRSA
jgi:hypothetical protein